MTLLATPDGWDSYLDSLQDQYRQKQISEATLQKAFSTISYLEHSVSADTSQSEFVKTFEDYYTKRVSDTRIENGKKMWKANLSILNRVYAKYGVHPRYLVSFWGLETNYGATKGSLPLLSTLATLAFDGRRRTFFEVQLQALLQEMDRGRLPLEKLTGSWAGAFGHFQFMPTTYAQYGVDGDGDGMIDLVNSFPDAVYSAANYLSRMGWAKDETWGREVMVLPRFNWGAYVEGEVLPLKVWHKRGVRSATGHFLPHVDLKAKLILPQGSDGPLFLVYENFDRIMKWNRSTFYALAVARLADRLMGYPKLHTPLLKEASLTQDQVRKAQYCLQEKSFYVGDIDGIIGKGMRKGIRDFESQNGLTPDGFLDQKTYDKLID